jgi:hypothetical protein
MGNDMGGIAKLLVITGLLMVLAGLVLYFLNKFPDMKPFPGDIVIKKERFTFYFPLGISILISILLTLLLYLWRKFGG